MLPERPNADGGDSNCQVKKNFSPTPGLTPADLYPKLSHGVAATILVHGTPALANTGVFWAGSEEWTSIEERHKTLLVVLELRAADRYRWRDVDADLRKRIANAELNEPCYLRYYIAPASAVYGEHPETAARRVAVEQERPQQMHREPSSPASLPELTLDNEPEPALRFEPRQTSTFNEYSDSQTRRRDRASRREAARTRRQRNDSATIESTVVVRPTSPTLAETHANYAAFWAREDAALQNHLHMQGYYEENPTTLPPAPDYTWQPTDEDLRQLGLRTTAWRDPARPGRLTVARTSFSRPRRAVENERPRALAYEGEPAGPPRLGAWGVARLSLGGAQEWP